MRAPVGRETLAKGRERPQTRPATGKSGQGSAKFGLGDYDLGRSPSPKSGDGRQATGKIHVSYRKLPVKFTGSKVYQTSVPGAEMTSGEKLGP